MKVPDNVLSGLKKEKEVLIAIHVNPDGDALGAALALSAALEAKGKKTYIYCKDPVPKVYTFMPGHSRIKHNVKRLLKNDPLLVLLDCNSPERAALGEYDFARSLVIDHHETESDFGDIKWIDRHAAATGMMVYALIRSLGITITAQIATNLYTAISVDTGTFRYSNTYPEVLQVSAELIELGAKPHKIANNLYETWDRKRFDLFIRTLNTLEIKSDIAMIYITEDMFRKTGTSHEDTENFSNFPRMIDSVKIAALFRESGRDTFRVSLRSKGNVNVAAIAECFEGGGHKNAAGFRIRADLKSAKEALLKTYKKISGKKRITAKKR
jgi:phosphoesterase RecJ-like protein